MDHEAIEQAVQRFLTAIGEDTDRPGLRQTPALVAGAAAELFSGMGADPVAAVEVLDGPDGLIMLRDIHYFSLCEHHLLPFFGRAHVAILPDGGRIAGLGSLSRVVDILSRRLQIQERLGEQIADAYWRALRPKGVFVALQAQQLCMQMRGGRHVGVDSWTVATRGLLGEAEWRPQMMQALTVGGR